MLESEATWQALNTYSGSVLRKKEKVEKDS